MRSDRLRVLDRPTVFQIRRNASSAEGVAARRGGESGFECPTLDHPEDVRARHRVRRDLAVLIDAPEERALRFVRDAGRLQIRIEVCLRIVVRGYLVALAAFLVQPDPPSLSVLVIILDTHVNHRRDACERVAHEPEECAITETDDCIRLDGIQKLPRLVRFQDRRLSALHDVFWSANGARRIHRDYLAGDEPVEEHADGREVLFHGRSGTLTLKLLYIGSNHHRVELIEHCDPVTVAPSEELSNRLSVSRSGVFVSNRRREEFEEPPRCAFAGARDDRRQRVEAGATEIPRRNIRQFAAHGRLDVFGRSRFLTSLLLID